VQRTIIDLINLIEAPSLASSKIIHWGAPIPSFGNIDDSKVATLGLNPSNREFVNVQGVELDGDERRFHSLKSLGIGNWKNISEDQVKKISGSCRDYFSTNPYNGWFKSLNNLISGTNSSYYNKASSAVHLDLIPFATSCKWTDLTQNEQKILLEISGSFLGQLLQESNIKVLILNGQAVINNFSLISNTSFTKKHQPDWTLPRKNSSGVSGFSYIGETSEISGVKLKNKVLTLGFNHNIQSSFGVTTKVKAAIQQWISNSTEEVLS
jgi:hypothetical protein